jgi:hypothetical protein
MICSEMSRTAPGECEQEQRVGLVHFADRFDRVEILRDHHKLHHVRGGRAGDGFLKLLDRALQAFDDCAALVGDALALQRLALRFRFGLLHHQDLLRLAAGVGGDLLALRGVDVVHRRFHFRVRHDVGDEHVDDLVAEARHVGVELLLHGSGNAGLAGEHLVERHAGHMAENYVPSIS